MSKNKIIKENEETKVTKEKVKKKKILLLSYSKILKNDIHSTN